MCVCVCLFAVCPGNLNHVVVHHYDPADPGAHRERHERPQQRPGEDGSHCEPPRRLVSESVEVDPLTYAPVSAYKYLISSERAPARGWPRLECTPVSPPLSPLTLCPPRAGRTNHPCGINFPPLSAKRFLLNAAVMFCMEDSLVKCIAELRSLTALGETLALTPLYWLII